MAIEDAAAAVEYAKCQEKHDQVSSLYEEVRQELIAFKAWLAKEVEEFND